MSQTIRWLLSLLRQVRQKARKNILSLAEEAYDNRRGHRIERQLIDIFVDGLLNDQLKMKILRDQPSYKVKLQ